MVANLITFFRLILLFFIFVILDYGGFSGHVTALFLVILLIILDGIDGIVARLLQESSEFGGVFDIAVDRIIENCIWIYFASRGIISFWIPVIVLTRGFLTDGVRSVALAKGMTAFGDKTLQKSRIGKILVSSRISRGLYGFSKVLSFLSLIILQALFYPEAKSFIPQSSHPMVMFWAYTFIYVTVAFCIFRGIPVIFDGWYLFSPKRHPNKP